MNRPEAKKLWLQGSKLQVSYPCPGKVFINMGRQKMTRELRDDLNHLLCRLMNGTDHNGPEHVEITISSDHHQEKISYNAHTQAIDPVQPIEPRLLENVINYSINGIDI